MRRPGASARRAHDRDGRARTSRPIPSATAGCSPTRRPPSHRGRGSPMRAPTSSTSAGSRRDRARSPSTRRKSGAGSIPVIEGLRRARPDAVLSVDTRRADVARAALDAGARSSTTSAPRGDPAMLPLVAERDAGLVLMHMRGEPRTMQDDPHYDDVVARGARVPARAGRGRRSSPASRRESARGRPRHRVRQGSRPQPGAAPRLRVVSRSGRGRRGRRVAQALPRHADRVSRIPSIASRVRSRRRLWRW